MSEKLLVADDSPTIQKVVGITLANTEYELVQAQSEEEMLSLLNSDEFDLVLLDFNLSEEKDGYELCSQVRLIKENLKIMIMLGTFDNVSDDRLDELGVVEKVIKPFESSKFIQKIKDAINTELVNPNITSEFDLNQDTFDLGQESPEPELDEESGWTISGPEGDGDQEEIIEVDDGPMPEGNFLEEDSSTNELASVVQGWGMSVPNVIDGNEEEGLLPPKMEEVDTTGVTQSSDSDSTGEWDAIALMEENEDSQSDELLPASDDLDYPELSTSEPSSSLISIDELSGVDEGEEEILEETDPQLIIAQQDDDPGLEKEIDGELAPDEFWAADDSYDISLEEEADSIKIETSEADEFVVEQHTSVEVGPKLEQDESHHPAVEALNELKSREDELEEVGPKLEQEPSNESLTSVNSTVNKDEIIASLKEELRPVIKELVKEVIAEMGKETSEKVAWEIIPDLAENLIRAEVERLSQKVQEKHSLS